MTLAGRSLNLENDSQTNMENGLCLDSTHSISSLLVWCELLSDGSTKNFRHLKIFRHNLLEHICFSEWTLVNETSLHLTEEWDMTNYGLLAVLWACRRHVMPFQIQFPAALFHQFPLNLFWKGSVVDQISSVLSPGKALPICVLCQKCNDNWKKQIETFVHDQRDDGAGIFTDSNEDVPLTDVDVSNKMCEPSVVLCKQGRSTPNFGS